jgi:MiaB/RimO family radical SAM methylthiotransferase
MHELTDDVSQADFVVLNTCGFTQEAEDHTITLLKGYTENGKKDTRIISVGCLNRIAPEVLEKELEDKVVVLEKESHLDRFFKKKIAYDDMREEYIEEDGVRGLSAELYNRSVGLYYYFQSAVKRTYPLLKKSPYLERLFNEIDQTNKSFVQIGTGCVGNCSYCIIKKARGSPVSRDARDILEDIRRVYTPGKSVYLVADDCGSYGCDIGLSLPFLLRKIHEAYPELTIDLNYLNPVWLEKQEKEFQKTFEEINIGSVNVSIQSGSNRIIKKMNRQYDVRRIRTIVKRLKETSPSTHFWTHCIVGFPGETWLDFLKTVRLVHMLHFVYTFGYSDRTGTESSRMDCKNAKATIFTKKLLIRSYAIAAVFVRGTGDLGKNVLSRGRRTKSIQNNVPQYNAQFEEDVT